MANAAITDLNTAAAVPDATDRWIVVRDGVTYRHVNTRVLTGACFATGAVDTEHVTNDAVTAGDFADGDVTAAKIAADQITAAKLETQAGVVAATYTMPLVSVTLVSGIITAIEGAP